MIDPIRATDDYQAATERPYGSTVFQYPIDVISDYIPSFKQSDGNPLDGQDTPIEYTIDANPVDDSNKFKRSIDIPDVLGLDLTDKTSRGVYEDGSSFKTRDANPVDATALNNPAVDGLGTGIIDNASPLGANFAGQNVLVQGTDPFYPPQYGASPQLANTETQDEQPVTKPSDCSWYDLPCVFQTLKGEVTILIVGLVLLAIGIYALTR